MKSLRKLIREMTLEEIDSIVPNIFSGRTTRGPDLQTHVSLGDVDVDVYMMHLAGWTQEVLASLQGLGDRVRGRVDLGHLSSNATAYYQITHRPRVIIDPNPSDDEAVETSDGGFAVLPKGRARWYYLGDISDLRRSGDTLTWVSRGLRLTRPIEDLVFPVEYEIRIAVDVKTDQGLFRGILEGHYLPDYDGESQSQTVSGFSERIKVELDNTIDYITHKLGQWDHFDDEEFVDDDDDHGDLD